MDITTFLISVYCLIGDGLGDRRLSARGPQSKPSDAEVLTIEVVGEFMGIDTDSGLYRYFRRHFAEWFPDLMRNFDSINPTLTKVTFTDNHADLGGGGLATASSSPTLNNVTLSQNYAP